MMLDKSTVLIIESKYYKRICKYPNVFKKIDRQIALKPEEEQVLLKFLYSTLPFSDVLCYSFEIIYSFVSHSVLLLQNNPKLLLKPQAFLNYIVYPRVGNEELSSCRQTFYDALKDRIAGKTTKQKVIEINYWCAEEVYYQSTDIRTASALSVYESAQGRCGEESVFTVNALRSAGIPSRQVYAPFWSHCDDNHAWVEVLIEDEWKFLGACEPEETLNQGWFLSAASRAMLVHSYVYGANFITDEEPLGRSGCVSQTNQTKRYAKTKQITITVENNAGAVKGANIALQLLNYANLQTIAHFKTDENGKICLNTGFGSLYYEITTSDEHCFGVIEKDETEIIIMLANFQKSGWEKFFIQAPKAFHLEKELLDITEKNNGEEKLNNANEMRNKKILGFEVWKNRPKAEQAFLKGAFANAAEITSFLDADKATYADRINLLATLSEKDLYDLNWQVLNSHLTATIAYKNNFPKDIFQKYLLAPRVGMEVLTNYAAAIARFFTAEQKLEFVKNPRQIWQYITENIMEYPNEEHPALITPPQAVLNGKTGSEQAKKVLFVAICRTFGVPARLRKEDNTAEYYQNGHFMPVDGIKKHPLKLLAGGGNWVYSSNWSIANWQKNTFVQQDLSDCIWENNELTTSLAAGEYRILTQNRITNGSVYGMSYSFSHSNNTPPITMQLAKVELSDMLVSIEIGTLNLESVQGGSINSSKPAIFIWLETGEEPTEHVLNELIENSDSFKATQIVFVITKYGDENYHTLLDLQKCLPNVKIMLDFEGVAGKKLARKVFLSPDTLPLVSIHHNNKSVYSICGYNVGTAEMLLKIIALLHEGVTGT